MKADVKSMTAMSVASLALMALMMVPGLLMQLTIVQAQPNERMICSGGGVIGCYTCGVNPTPGNEGCNGDTTPPPAWTVGICIEAGPGSTCTWAGMDCGDWINCATGTPIGGSCTTLTICI